MGGWEAAFVRSKRRERWPFRPMDVNVDAWSLRPSLTCGVMGESRQARYGTSNRRERCGQRLITASGAPIESGVVIHRFLLAGRRVCCEPPRPPSNSVAHRDSSRVLRPATEWSAALARSEFYRCSTWVRPSLPVAHRAQSERAGSVFRPSAAAGVERRIVTVGQ